MTKFRIAFGLLLLLITDTLLLSCKPGYQTYAYSPQPDEHVTDSTRPEILFMIFSIRQSNGASVIELKDRKIKYGALKGDPESSDAPDRIFVAQLDHNNTEIFGYYIEHPLRKYVEYVNERNELATKLVEFEEAEFFIRTTLDRRTVSIRLDEVREGSVLKSFVFNVRD